MSEVRLRAVSKSYGGKAVLHPLDLDVPDGAFVALLGPSGCGKTTLLRMIAGLEKPDGGEIRIGDRTVFGPDCDVPPEKRRLGMVFQSYAVWPHLDVLENVAFPLRYGTERPDRPAREARAREALKLVHLEALAARKPHQLSGGQQQRVALARGLVAEPEVLLLDEPLSNLDAKLRAEMRREIRALHRAGRAGGKPMTFLYVTHDQREAFEMATWVVLLDRGRIEQQGKPEEIRASPKAGFAREFLAET